MTSSPPAGAIDHRLGTDRTLVAGRRFVYTIVDRLPEYRIPRLEVTGRIGRNRRRDLWLFPDSAVLVSGPRLSFDRHVSAGGSTDPSSSAGERRNTEVPLETLPVGWRGWGTRGSRWCLGRCRSSDRRHVTIFQL